MIACVPQAAGCTDSCKAACLHGRLHAACVQSKHSCLRPVWWRLACFCHSSCVPASRLGTLLIWLRQGPVCILYISVWECWWEHGGLLPQGGRLPQNTQLQYTWVACCLCTRCVPCVVCIQAQSAPCWCGSTVLLSAQGIWGLMHLMLGFWVRACCQQLASATAVLFVNRLCIDTFWRPPAKGLRRACF